MSFVAHMRRNDEPLFRPIQALTSSTGLLITGIISLHAVLLRFKRHRSRPRPDYAVQTGSPPILERKEDCHAPCAQPSTDTIASRCYLMLLMVRIAPRRSSNLLCVACGAFSFDNASSRDQIHRCVVPGASTGRYCTLLL